jgi:hypothetical protein
MHYALVIPLRLASQLPSNVLAIDKVRHKFFAPSNHSNGFGFVVVRDRRTDQRVSSLYADKEIPNLNSLLNNS